MFQNPSQTQLTDILKSARTIAVVGLSDNPERTSYRIAEQMQRRGYRVIPVNPSVSHVLGEPAYASLAEVQEPFDIVNVFRRSDALTGVVQDALQTSAPVIWHSRVFTTKRRPISLITTTVQWSWISALLLHIHYSFMPRNDARLVGYSDTL